MNPNIVSYRIIAGRLVGVSAFGTPIVTMLAPVYVAQPDSDSGEVYNHTQIDDSITHGTVLVVPSERVAGILVQAWPVALTPARGGFHRFQSPIGSFDWNAKFNQPGMPGLDAALCRIVAGLFPAPVAL